MERAEAPSYKIATALFLRLTAACFLCAFVSLWVQVDGLIGSSGILPVSRFLAAAREALGPERFRLLPTLCWLGSSDAALHALCGAGAIVSVLALAGAAPALCLFLAWALYLSLCVAGQVFFEFQWDFLLLETGLLAVLLAAPRLSPRAARAAPISGFALFLLRFLLFRLNLSSGLVKLESGDRTWRNLSALSHHYETQPLPPWTAWYFHQLPASFHVASCVILFAVELAVPFFVFGPARVRRLAGAALAGLQILIAVSGNYAFFNILTLALCVLCFDDALFPERLRARAPAEAGRGWPRWVVWPSGGVLLFAASVHLATLVPGLPLPRPIVALVNVLAPFRSANGYGLFAVMTTERPEIVVEGSEDGQTWKPYEFRWKPGDVTRRPRFVAPHQPRLDWQMWFAALGSYEQQPWFLGFCARLLQGSPSVTALLAKDPFPGAPPRYLRAVVYDYRFTSRAERRATGAWWTREEKGLYLPVLSKDMLREAR